MNRSIAAAISLVFPLAPAAEATTPHSIAPSFVVPTSEGDWSYSPASSEADESTLFLVYAPGRIRSGGAADFSKELFTSSASSVGALVSASPKNTHYVFMWLADQAGFNSFASRARAEIASLPAADRDHWSSRVHFVTTQADKVAGWAGDVVRTRMATPMPYKRFDPFQWGVDSKGRVREVGMLGRLGNGGVDADLTFLASESAYYEFERVREARLAAENAAVVPLLNSVVIADEAIVEASLPDAAAMSKFDSLEVDLAINCENRRDGECGAWDYLANLYLCDDAPGEARRCDVEVARWITPYWREGRWVTDISGLLPLFKEGGHRTLRWYALKQWSPRAANYVLSMSLRFSAKNKPIRPVSVIPLFSGGELNSGYNAAHPAMHIDVPADARKVELVALVTGHGSDEEQCAEFCDHRHHFAVNGAKHVVMFPDVQTLDGCRDRVSEGVVPNQHGTWYFGRGGWCPGLDVKPTVFDVTADVKRGAANEVAYRATIGESEMAAAKRYGNAVMTSYLVVWK